MIVSVFAGFPVAFCLMGIALIFGIFGFGDSLPPMLIRRVYGMADNYVLVAVPLFIFMGTMLERSGIAKRLFEAISIWTGRLKGGLAISTILMCTIIAACTGIIGASEVMVGVMAIPAMLKGTSSLIWAYMRSPVVLKRPKKKKRTTNTARLLPL